MRESCPRRGRPPDRAVPTEYPAVPPWRTMASRTTAGRPAMPRSADDVATLAWTGDLLPIKEVVTRSTPEQENRAAGRFVKPSAGLEPAASSLPWRSGHRGHSSPDGQNRCAAAHRVAGPGRTDRHVSTPPVPTGYPAPRGAFRARARAVTPRQSERTPKSRRLRVRLHQRERRGWLAARPRGGGQPRLGRLGARVHVRRVAGRPWGCPGVGG